MTFEKFAFQPKQIENYFRSAVRDYKIASDSDVPEIIFKFCYDALIKLAIAVSAKNSLRAKARQGHHIDLLAKMADFLGNKEIEVVGNEMRKKRNWDLYSGGVLISAKEAGEYRDWLKKVFKRSESYLFAEKGLF